MKITCALPPVESKSPVSIEIVVVFPAPLWPRRTNIYPEYIERFKFYTAFFPFG